MPPLLPPFNVRKMVMRLLALVSQYANDDKNYNECDTYHDDNVDSGTAADDIISSDIGSITNDQHKNKTPLSGIIENNFRYQDLLRNSNN